MNATPRVAYAWARSSGYFKVLTRVDAKSGIPRPALWLSFALSVFWTLPFPSWDVLVGVVSAAMVLSYAVAPVTAAALRRTAPGLVRPFRVAGFAWVGPLSFVIATWILYWAGWSTLRWLLALQLVMFVLDVALRLPSVENRALLPGQIKASLWLLGYYLLLLPASWAGTFGGHGWIAHPWDLAVVGLIALLVYYWGAATGVSDQVRVGDEDAGE